MKKKLLGGLAIAALVAGIAWAQVTIPLVTQLNQNDIVQVVPRGQPSAQSYYANPGVVAGVEQYQYASPAVGFNLVVSPGVSFMMLSPSGTLATGILTFEALPSDGQKFCLYDSQTQTAISISPNANQTLATGISPVIPTALASNAQYCWKYIAPQAAWVRTG